MWICSGVNMNVLSRKGGKLVLLVSQTMHVFARGGGNCELLGTWCPKGCQVCFVSIKYLCMCLPDGVAILNCSGGKRTVLVG
jgi:hypothetical protein